MSQGKLHCENMVNTTTKPLLQNPDGANRVAVDCQQTECKSWSYFEQDGTRLWLCRGETGTQHRRTKDSKIGWQQWSSGVRSPVA